MLRHSVIIGYDKADTSGLTSGGRQGQNDVFRWHILLPKHTFTHEHRLKHTHAVYTHVYTHT